MSAVKIANTKQQIIEIAGELIQTRGYNGFSYQDISDKLKIKKASIHYHFPAKEDLGLAILHWHHEEIFKWMESHGVATATPIEKLEGYFQWHFEETMDDCNKVCIFGALATEWNILPEKLREGMEQFEKWHLEFLSSVLREGIKEGLFVQRGPVVEQALFVAAATQGALQMARERQSKETYHAITRQILLSLRKMPS